jgi:hypothetical protein
LLIQIYMKKKRNAGCYELSLNKKLYIFIITSA